MSSFSSVLHAAAAVTEPSAVRMLQAIFGDSVGAAATTAVRGETTLWGPCTLVDLTHSADAFGVSSSADDECIICTQSLLGHGAVAHCFGYVKNIPYSVSEIEASHRLHVTCLWRVYAASQ